MLTEFMPEHQTHNAKFLPTSFPHAARTPEETGLPFLFLVELVSKVLFLRGQVRLSELSTYLKLPISVLDPVIAFMRSEKLCEAIRRGISGTDADLTYNLTDAGRVRAVEILSRNAYAGPAPVSLNDYCLRVEAQRLVQNRIHKEDVACAFKGIVVSPVVLEQLGAAMNSGRAIFIHGPAGSGKTYLAERLAGLLKGDIWVPHAVLVDGEVVQIYDATVHHAASDSALQTGRVDRGILPDARWVRVGRPAVLSGGELTLNMLDLQFDSTTRFYHAPPHLKANNGLFIIDDLGRQRCSPAELMSRWIVPLDRRVDYLSLHTGHKFLIPFDMVVVFSSNFPPQQLADGSFLRRLGYKIHVGAQTDAEYERIFRQACDEYDVPYSADAFHYLLERHSKEEVPLLACYPRDIVAQVKDIARYTDIAPNLNEPILDWAWNNYFTGG
ncbi:MAG: ATPase [Herminiimonas sp.]|nr:ATPase [Herminiimonas sp.]